MSLEARAAERDEYAKVAEQWGVITEDPMGPDDVAKRRRQLEWWLGDTPNGAGVLAVVEEEGDYLGVAGWCPKRLLVDGESVPVAEIGTTMTSPKARGKGVFSRLVNFLKDAAADRQLKLLFGTPNEASGHIYIGKLDFIGVWPWSRWVRPIGSATGLPFGALGALRSGMQIGAHPKGATVEALTDWDQAAKCQAGDWTDAPHIDRTADYLEWRYPRDRYDVFGARDSDSALIGWAALGRSTRLGRPALVVADAVVGESLGSGGWFIREVIRAARQAGRRESISFSMSAPRGALARAFACSGFVSRPSEMPLIVYAVDKDFDAAEVVNKMAFVAGDSDTV